MIKSGAKNEIRKGFWLPLGENWYSSNEKKIDFEDIQLVIEWFNDDLWWPKSSVIIENRKKPPDSFYDQMQLRNGLFSAVIEIANTYLDNDREKDVS